CGAFAAWLMLDLAGIGYWPSLVLAPLLVGALGVVIERSMLQRLYRVDPLYGLLLTFGLALIIQGAFSLGFGSSGQSYQVPSALQGALDLKFVVLPYYRAWVVVFSVVVCAAVWFQIERTRLGALLRA